MTGMIHVDADAFFASVEQAADPRLRGRPMAVGGERRGIIASASYEARQFGIHTPMPTARARRLCPRLIVVPGDFEKYEQFSRWMFSYAYDFTPDVEITSIDEGYFDLSGAGRPAREIALEIRRAIHDGLKITVSEGLAANKVVSQIASKLNKPNAFVEVPAGREKEFLAPLANRWLPGVGPVVGARLDLAGLTRIGQIADTPADWLAQLVGTGAPTLRRFANGIDDRPLVREKEPAKSYSHQETFAEDVTDEAFIEAVLRRMADRLMAAVREDGKMIRTLTVRVRYNDFAEDQRSESLAEPTDLETDVYGRLRPMLRAAWRRRVSLRLVSLKCSNVYDRFHSAELPLFTAAGDRAAQRRLAAVLDDLRKNRRYVVMRGHDIFLRDRPAHAARLSGKPVFDRRPATRTPGWIPLHVHSHYTFLDSTLSPKEIVAQAAKYDCPAVALTDTGNLHGAVPFVQAARAAGIKPILGAEVRVDGQPLLLYVQNREGYRNLCRILARGYRFSVIGSRLSPSPKTGNRQPAAAPLDTAGLIAVGADPALADLFPGAFYLGRAAPPAERERPRRRPAVAVPGIHYAEPAHRRRYDIVQSIRTLTLLDHPHPEKKRGDHAFPPPAAVAGRFREEPDLVERTREIAARCAFELEFGRLQFPAFAPPDGSTPADFLRRRVREGLPGRYGSANAAVRDQIEEELRIIHEVGYEEYFLIVWDLLQECRRRGIDWLTRGSAADSLVCYCLGISRVCPIRFDLYFRRFLNRERMRMNKLPDIDVDFPHDRRDEVFDLIFEKYGAAHTALVGGFSTFQARSAFAEVAKVLGLSDYQARRFTERLPWSGPAGLAEKLRASPDGGDLPVNEEPYRTALETAVFLDGAPRYAKMHPCGIVVARDPILDLVPTFATAKGYPATQFDMDGVEAIGLVKFDILAQGGLAVIRDVGKMIETSKRPNAQTSTERPAIASIDVAPFRPFDFSTRGPWDHPRVWDLIAGGEARAVHHIESPAMIGLCRQCNVRDIDTLVAVVSLIRPGAANEHKKRAFARRHQGREPVRYPHPSLEPCLKGTYGLIIFEEQVLQICEAFAGLPPEPADRLRRALIKQDEETVARIGPSFGAAARARGRTDEEIVTVWKLLLGFCGYAFCKAHSAAYAVEAYESAWLKWHYPAEFMAAVLTHGKGFYHPLVYALECYRLGLGFRPPCVNHPGPGFLVEKSGSRGEGAAPPAPARLRVPVGRVKGLGERTIERIARERERGAFESPADFVERVQPSADDLDRLLRVGALDGFGLSRTALFWEIRQRKERWGAGENGGNRDPDPPRSRSPRLPFPSDAHDLRAPPVPLTEPTRKQRLQWEMDLLDFTASGHPLELYDDIAWDTYCPVAELSAQAGRTVTCCGLIVEERVTPQTSGEPMKFLTLADRTGLIETELFAPTYRRYGLATVRYPVLEITATVEPFENGRGCTLRVHRAGAPRRRPPPPPGIV